MHAGKTGERVIKGQEDTKQNKNLNAADDGWRTGSYAADTIADLLKSKYKDAADILKRSNSGAKVIPDIVEMYDHGKNSEWGKAAKSGVDLLKDGSDIAQEFAPKLKSLAGKLGWAGSLASTMDGLYDAGDDIKNGHYWKAAWDTAKTLPDAYKTISPFVGSGALAGDVMALPAAVPVVATLAAGAGGAYLGHKIYENSPQVRDYSGGIFSGIASGINHAFGHMSDEDRQTYLAQLEAEHVKQYNAQLARNGKIAHSPGITDDSLNPDLNKSIYERAGNLLGETSGRMGTFGGWPFSSSVDQEKEEMRRQFQQTMDDRDRRWAQQKAAQATQ